MVIKYVGVSFLEVLGIVFITLKLLGVGTVATWSWWLVLLPIYLPIVIALSFMVISGTYILLLLLGSAICDGFRKFKGE